MKKLCGNISGAWKRKQEAEKDEKERGLLEEIPVKLAVKEAKCHQLCRQQVLII